MELGIPYSFTGWDGSRFVIGNSATAKADPDWIGTLDPDNAITGLLDGAEARAAVQPIPRGHGARIGPTYRGERSGTVQGMFDPNATVATVEGVYIPKYQRVVAAAQQADAIMRWTPTYDGIPRMLRVRHVAGRADVRGRRPKTFLAALTSPDPFVLSDAEVRLTIGPFNGATQLGTGIATPHVGGARTWPRIYIEGAMTDPEIWLYEASGLRAQVMAIDQVIAADERLIVLPERRTAVLGDRAIAYGFEFGATTGWNITPTYLSNVPTSLTLAAGAPTHNGGYRGDIVSPAGGLNGPHIIVPGPFYKGRTYAGRVWARSQGALGDVQLAVGDGAGGSNAVGAPVTLAAGGAAPYVPLDVLWSPTHYTPTAIFAPRTVGTAGALTWRVDDASLLEVGKQQDFMWALANPVDVSGAIAGAHMLDLDPGANGELVVHCASSGSESYVHMIFNHAWP